MERVGNIFREMTRRAVVTLLLAVMTAWPVGSYAQTTYNNNGWGFKILDAYSVMLVSYDGSATSITTPTTIRHESKDYSVTRIKDRCFSQKSVTSIVISEGVEYIGEYAFTSCKNLESVTLPSTLNTLGDYAFSSCTKLPSITLPSHVTAIGDGTFANCTSLASVTFNGNVTSIGADAFSLCISLTAITLPGSVSSIGNGAFYGCNKLTSITLPRGVTAIGRQTFKNCEKLASVTLEGNVVTIGQEAFQECHMLSDFTLPNSVKTIEDCAFFECYSLSSITIPSEVSIIGKQTFQSCSSLANVTINGNITTIEEYAFYQCPIAQITLPYSVVIIDKCAFAGCGLRNLYYAGQKGRWESMVYKGENALPSSTIIHWRCTATYDMQGHGSAPAAQTVYSGVARALTAPASDPTAQGWDFGGWYGDAGCTVDYDFGAALSDNTTIYAKWTPRTDNVVTFDTGGKGTAIDAQTLTTGQTATEPDVRYYHDATANKDMGIEGWYTDAGCTEAYDFTTAVDRSFTLYAKWAEAGHCTLTASAGGIVALSDAKGRTPDGDGRFMPGPYTLTVTPQSGYSYTGTYTLTVRNGGGSTDFSIGGSSTLSRPIDLTAKDLAVSVTFSEMNTYQVYVNKMTDGTATAGTFTLNDSNTPAHSYTGNGETLAKVNDGSEQLWSPAYNLTLTVEPGSGQGCAMTIVNNGVTTYVDASTASYTFTPTGSVTINLYYFVLPEEGHVDVLLYDDRENNSIWVDWYNDGQPHTVTLIGRRLWKDGNWNTLCLPFTLRSLTGTPLEGATVIRLNTTGTTGTGSNKKYKTRLDDDGTLYLSFMEVSSIEAGTPYLVRWATAGDPIDNPMFNGVFITATEPGSVKSHDTKVSFEGTYDALASTSGLLTAGRTDDNGALRAALRITEPTREGYTFSGWKITAEGPVAIVTTIYVLPNNSIALYANWTENAITIDGTGDTGITTDLTNLNGKVADVTLTRTFPAGRKQTVCLPFDPTALLTHGKVWQFTGISEESGLKKAVMTEITSPATLSANTPYIFEATSEVTSITFSDVAISIGADPKTVDDVEGFTFHGTYEQKVWEADDAAVTGGTIYGFMMKENDGQAVGQFVKARRRTVLRPFSCWLEYNGNLDDTNPASHVQLRAGTRATGDALPDVIEIVWLGGSGIPGTTGMMDTRTGQIYEDDAWYSIYGTKLDGRPSKTGLYINNGKKVYITAE